jgi:DUF2892 family protein
MKLQRNIGGSGRILRGLCGFASAIAALYFWSRSMITAAALVFASVFLFFEAARGWCALRACRLRTPL